MKQLINQTRLQLRNRWWIVRFRCLPHIAGEFFDKNMCLVGKSYGTTRMMVDTRTDWSLLFLKIYFQLPRQRLPSVPVTDRSNLTFTISRNLTLLTVFVDTEQLRSIIVTHVLLNQFWHFKKPTPLPAGWLSNILKLPTLYAKLQAIFNFVWHLAKD